MSSPSPGTPPSKPAAIEHLNQARQNYQLFQQLKQSGEHLDWAVTLLFYTALHLIQAYFVETASSGFDIPRDHEDRDRRVRLRLGSIFNDYSFLQTRSNWARYQPGKPKPTPELLHQYESNQFARIVNELRRLGFPLVS